MTPKEKQKLQIKEWGKKHPKKLLAYSRKSERVNKKKRVAYKAKYYLEHKAQVLLKCWQNKIKRKYKISSEDYFQMLADQNNSCGICKGANAGTKDSRFRIDHCHKTGKVRGLLCHKCNAGIGMLGDNFTSVNAAAEYLKKAEKMNIIFRI